MIRKTKTIQLNQFRFLNLIYESNHQPDLYYLTFLKIRP